jgi:hypothetical protein
MLTRLHSISTGAGDLSAPVVSPMTTGMEFGPLGPLLSASPGSLVLVTSRGQLAGLAAADGPRARRRSRADAAPHAGTRGGAAISGVVQSKRAQGMEGISGRARSIQDRRPFGSQNRIPQSQEARPSSGPRLLTCCFFGVGEGTRTPGPQDHNLVL